MEKDYSAVEKQQALEQLKKNQKRLYLRGKTIVYVIAIINIIEAVVSVLTSLNSTTLLVQIGLSIALLRGVPWVRYFFAITAGLSAFLDFYFLFGHMDFSVQSGLVIYLVLTLIYSIASCVVLFTSKSVSEFLYTQENG